MRGLLRQPSQGQPRLSLFLNSKPHSGHPGWLPGGLWSALAALDWPPRLQAQKWPRPEFAPVCLPFPFLLSQTAAASADFVLHLHTRSPPSIPPSTPLPSVGSRSLPERLFSRSIPLPKIDLHANVLSALHSKPKSPRPHSSLDPMSRRLCMSIEPLHAASSSF